MIFPPGPRFTFHPIHASGTLVALPSQYIVRLHACVEWKTKFEVQRRELEKVSEKKGGMEISDVINDLGSTNAMEKK